MIIQDFGSMFGSLPNGASPQELFISPLENVSSMDSQNAYAPVAPLNVYSQVSSTTPPSTYSASPAPSDFSLPMHATQPHRVFEACAQTQTKGAGANLDVDMAAYTDGLANFNIPMDMGLSYFVPEMPPLSFDISGQILADALQERQQQPQQQQVHMAIAAPIAVPVDTGFAFNDVINEF
jgi:hypothetical protein